MLELWPVSAAQVGRTCSRGAAWADSLQALATCSPGAATPGSAARRRSDQWFRADFESDHIAKGESERVGEQVEQVRMPAGVEKSPSRSRSSAPSTSTLPISRSGAVRGRPEYRPGGPSLVSLAQGAGQARARFRRIARPRTVQRRGLSAQRPAQPLVPRGVASR